MYRLLRLLCLLGLLIAAPVGHAYSVPQKEKVDKLPMGAPTSKRVGDKMLSGVGIKKPSDIESVVISYWRSTYKLTYKDNPKLVTRLYTALRETYFISTRVPIVGDRLILNLKKGKSVWLQFGVDSDSPSWADIMNAYESAELPLVLQDIKNDAKAATIDARIGDFEIDHVKIQLPHNDEIFLSLDENPALVTKAKQLIDCLDLRNAVARTVRSGEVGQAGAKFGIVSFYLTKPIQIEVMVWSEPSRPLPNFFEHNISFKRFRCDIISVLDYGNYTPPLIALHDKDNSDIYYLCPRLTRREQEKYGVEKLGFPGHPITDTDYYRSPLELYKELQELTKIAYDNHAKK